MKPEFVEQKSLLLAGVIDCGESVTNIDIHRLWDAYSKMEPDIPYKVEGAWYELHVGIERFGGLYTVIAGVEVSAIEGLPFETCLKVVPAGNYAYFAHAMKDGGFGEAFARIEAWVEENGIRTKDFGLQMYDLNYDPGDENSVLHIYIPLN